MTISNVAPMSAPVLSASSILKTADADEMEKLVMEAAMSLVESDSVTWEERSASSIIKEVRRLSFGDFLLVAG